MAVRARLSVVLFLVAVGCCSCSHEPTRKTEVAVEQAVNKFHDDLNQGNYEKVYLGADSVLKETLTQDELSARLRYAHEQLGNTSAQASVFVHDSVWRGLRQTISSAREIVSHGDIPYSDLIIGQEKFLWAVENDQAKLVAYEFRTVCSKPCEMSFK